MPTTDAPTIPATPALDALFTGRANGQERYTGNQDNALTIYTALKNGNEPDALAVPESEIAAATAYEGAVWEYMKLHGGFTPQTNPNAEPIPRTAVGAVLETLPEPKDEPEEVSAIIPEPPADASVTISADEHQKSKGILARIESYLNMEEKALVAELRAIWKHE